jgi:hypothetical protein
VVDPPLGKAVENVPLESGFVGLDGAGQGSAPLAGDKRRLVREQLERIMASEAFRGSRRSREFLAHIAEKTLGGEPDLLKERLIGVHLYGKTGDYDTSSDSTVRVRANEVRRRLLQYSEQNGREEAFRIVLPSGSYVPEFRPVTGRPQTPAAFSLSRGWLIGPTIAALLVCALAFRWLLSPDSLFKEFWRPLVLGNHGVVLAVQGAAGPAGGETVPLRSVRQLLRIHDISQAFGGRAEVVMMDAAPLLSEARSVQILLGRSLGASLSAPVALRYRVEPPDGVILDVPTGRRYRTKPAGSGRQESYALVTRIVPRSDGAGALALNGTDDLAVETAEELVTDPAALGDALRPAGVAAVARDLQILLSVQHSAGEIWKRDVIAVLTYP